MVPEGSLPPVEDVDLLLVEVGGLLCGLSLVEGGGLSLVTGKAPRKDSTFPSGPLPLLDVASVLGEGVLPVPSEAVTLLDDGLVPGDAVLNEDTNGALVVPDGPLRVPGIAFFLPWTLSLPEAGILTDKDVDVVRVEWETNRKGSSTQVSKQLRPAQQR